MFLEEFNKLVQQEIDWLRYYACHEDKKSLTPDKHPYDMRPMGYTKVRTPLRIRCAAAMLSATYVITEKSKVKDLFIVQRTHSPADNVYTPLEIYWMIFPNRRQHVIDKLNSINK